MEILQNEQGILQNGMYALTRNKGYCSVYFVPCPCEACSRSNAEKLGGGGDVMNYIGGGIMHEIGNDEENSNGSL